MPIGGGGLIAGIAIAIKSINPTIRIIGVQSENVHGMAASILRLHADNADCRVNGFNRDRDTGN